MSNPAHLWLTDENGSPIVGSCMMPTRLGSIELHSVNHNLRIPADTQTGRLTGTRVHSPLVMQKEFDQTTPLLLRALCEGRTLKSATIKMYHILDAGIEHEYFNIIMENIKITSITPNLHPSGMSITHFEDIELRYESITWKHTDGNILYKDSWNQRVTA